MEITVNKENTKLTLVPIGRVDTVTAPEFEASIKENIEGVNDLVIDLAKLQYISSAGLRVLLATQKTMNKQGNMKLINVSPDVMEVFEITGFSDILTIE